MTISIERQYAKAGLKDNEDRKRNCGITADRDFTIRPHTTQSPVSSWRGRVITQRKDVTTHALKAQNFRRCRLHK